MEKFNEKIASWKEFDDYLWENLTSKEYEALSEDFNYLKDTIERKISYLLDHKKFSVEIEEIIKHVNIYDKFPKGEPKEKLINTCRKIIENALKKASEPI